MKIVYQNNEGVTVIVHPCPQNQVAEWNPSVGEMSENQYLKFIMEKDVPANAKHVRIVQDSDIPSDMTFRDALKPDLTFDIDKAVEITKNRLRQERAPLLQKLDVDVMIAMENGEPFDHIVAEKKRLRAVTDLAHNGLTLDELKGLTIHG